jgi:hypothetical protein
MALPDVCPLCGRPIDPAIRQLQGPPDAFVSRRLRAENHRDGGAEVEVHSRQQSIVGLRHHRVGVLLVRGQQNIGSGRSGELHGHRRHLVLSVRAMMCELELGRTRFAALD